MKIETILERLDFDRKIYYIFGDILVVKKKKHYLHEIMEIEEDEGKSVILMVVVFDFF